MRTPSLTTLILIGLLLGIMTGLFFGERAEILQPIGDAFIRLLQMAVLPYFIVALPLGFGRLSLDEAKMLAVRLGTFSVILWVMALVMVVLLPLTFPSLTSASFFSAALVESPSDVDFVDLYIPANPFKSLSEAIIPGVVVFGIAVGIALISVPQKRELLTVLTSLADALGRITAFVVRLTPVGIFALAAGASGTMTLEDLSRLQVYIIAYTVGALIITFWMVPMLIAMLTPFSFSEVLRVTRDPLVTGFTTGNLFVVLAMLAENCKSLFQRKDHVDYRHAESIIDVSLPIAFTFPNLGVVLLLLFVPFAGWFTGNEVSPADYPKLAVLGFFSFFGSVEIGLPFLLQQLRIPTDMFQLHVVTLVYIGRMATLLAVMHLAAVALLSAAGNARWLRFRPRQAMSLAISTSVILVAALGGTTLLLRQTVDQSYSKNELIANMNPVRYPTRGKVYDGPAVRTEQNLPDETLLRVRESGVLRVGYDPDGLPFSFLNDTGELVGLDIEMVEAFAEEINVDVEYYPYRKSEMEKSLNEAYACDLLVGGLFATTRRVETMRFSVPYLDLHLSLITSDHRKEEFARLASLSETKQLRIAVLERPYFGSRIKQVIPNAEILLIETPREFFDSPGKFDALVMSAEAGSAWTLLYPQYHVVIPEDARLTVSVGFPMARRSSHFEELLSRWIDLKRKDGTVELLYAHWIEGANTSSSGPRWCIWDDVLGWDQGSESARIASRR